MNTPENKDLCWECTGSGLMGGGYPCKICRGTGYIPKDKVMSKTLEQQVTGKCIHFNGIQNKVCDAGIAYESFGHRKIGVIPCLGGTATCDKLRFPTPEEAEKELKEIINFSDKGINLLIAAKEHYEKLKYSSAMFTCPICKENACYTVASNGHFAVSCVKCGINLRE